MWQKVNEYHWIIEGKEMYLNSRYELIQQEPLTLAAQALEELGATEVYAVHHPVYLVPAMSESKIRLYSQLIVTDSHLSS